jgi:thiaminase
LFVPGKLYLAALSKQSFKKYVCTDVAYLQGQIKILENICQERLDLMNEIQKAADERLKMVQDLTKIAEDRLRVILSLDDELQRLRKGV